RKQDCLCPQLPPCTWLYSEQYLTSHSPTFAALSSGGSNERSSAEAKGAACTPKPAGQGDRHPVAAPRKLRPRTSSSQNQAVSDPPPAGRPRAVVNETTKPTPSPRTSSPRVGPR